VGRSEREARVSRVKVVLGAEKKKKKKKKKKSREMKICC
jgi:hypothetical protein